MHASIHSSVHPTFLKYWSLWQGWRSLLSSTDSYRNPAESYHSGGFRWVSVLALMQAKIGKCIPVEWRPECTQECGNRNWPERNPVRIFYSILWLPYTGIPRPAQTTAPRPSMPSPPPINAIICHIPSHHHYDASRLERHAKRPRHHATSRHHFPFHHHYGASRHDHDVKRPRHDATSHPSLSITIPFHNHPFLPPPRRVKTRPWHETTTTTPRHATPVAFHHHRPFPPPPSPFPHHHHPFPPLQHVKTQPPTWNDTTTMPRHAANARRNDTKKNDHGSKLGRTRRTGGTYPFFLIIYISLININPPQHPPSSRTRETRPFGRVSRVPLH